MKRRKSAREKRSRGRRGWEKRKGKRRMGVCDGGRKRRMKVREKRRDVRSYEGERGVCMLSSFSTKWTYLLFYLNQLRLSHYENRHSNFISSKNSLLSCSLAIKYQDLPWLPQLWFLPPSAPADRGVWLPGGGSILQGRRRLFYVLCRGMCR